MSVKTNQAHTELNQPNPEFTQLYSSSSTSKAPSPPPPSLPPSLVLNAPSVPRPRGESARGI